MKLAKEQRAARSKAIDRRLQFLRGTLLASVGWFAKLVFIGSWAVIGGLLAGPEHDFFLKQVYAWMVATPVDHVLTQSHAMFMSAAWEVGKMSMLLGVSQTLLAVVKPAAEQVKQHFQTMEQAAA